MGQSNNQRWNEAFAFLVAFKRREGHTLVQRHHIEKGFRLGQWVAVQRYFHRYHRLPPERETRLNAIGFVWGRREWLWERGFAALQKFKKRERHCLVHALHVENDVHLGNWVTVQRRMKNKMPGERKTFHHILHGNVALSSREQELRQRQQPVFVGLAC